MTKRLLSAAVMKNAAENSTEVDILLFVLLVCSLATVSTADVPLITSSAFFGRLTTEVFAEEGYTSLFLSLVSRGLFSSGYICGETAIGDPTTVFRPSLIGLGMTTACTAAIRNVAAGKTTAEEEDYIVNVLFHDFSPFSGLYQKKQVSPILLWNSYGTPMESVHHLPQIMTTAECCSFDSLPGAWECDFLLARKTKIRSSLSLRGKV